MLHQITFDEPRRARQINRAIPADLETIVLKAMAKEPAQRYATAGELAEDLTRFLEHQPIRARRPSLLERAAKWSRRHRPAVTAAAVVLLLLALVSPLVAWKQASLRRSADTQKNLAREKAEEARLATSSSAV